MNAFIRGVGQSVGATEVGRLTALLAAGALGLMIVGVAGFAHIHVVRNAGRLPPHDGLPLSVCLPPCGCFDS